MKTRIDLDVLLPGATGEESGTAERLTESLARVRGVERSHIKTEDGKASLCLHYDPEVTTLASIEQAAKEAGSDISAKYGHGTFPIRLMDGENAGGALEKSLLAQKGVIGASASLPAQVVRVEWERSATNEDAIRRAIGELGAAAGSPSKPAADGKTPGDIHKGESKEKAAEPGHSHGEGGSWLANNKELVMSLVAGLLVLVGFLAERAGVSGFQGPAIPGEEGGHRAGPIAIGVFIVAYILGGYDLTAHWVKSLFKGKFSFNVDLLMILAAIGAAILGNWAEGAFLLFLFSIAHSLEHLAMDRARGAIRALAELTPDTALVKRDGRAVEVAIAEVQVGDIVLVHPGERLPVDGEVDAGTSSVNQAPITGESVPVEKAKGDPVFAGSVNGDGALEIKTSKAVGDRTLDRVIKLVEEAQTQKAPTEVFSERFSAIFVPIVLVADVLLIVVPPALNLLPLSESFYRAMGLLVAATPCALALGTPSSVLAAIARAAREGVLFKGGAHLENLGNIKAIAFDKTGTLTVGEPSVTDVVPAAGVSEEELLAVASAVERKSQHPLARAVVRHAEERKVTEPSDVGELQSVTGKGVRTTVSGQPVELGSTKMWPSVPAEISGASDRLGSMGRSVVVVRQGERFLGSIGVADTARKGVNATLDSLRALNVRPLVMLTGDNKGVGEAIGRQVGVDEVKADLLPEDKVTAINELLQAHGRVAMIGDGVNDAPALANATVGIAMGGAGTAVALETADVALMGDRLDRLPFAVGLARQASSIIRQNLYIALGIIAFLVIMTVGGFAGIGFAVTIHEGSTLVVLANALRLLRYRGNLTPA